MLSTIAILLVGCFVVFAVVLSLAALTGGRLRSGPVPVAPRAGARGARRLPRSAGSAMSGLVR
jgi:hypothetical protein